MRAIQTKYRGYRFRSRTEARWAVFFDAIGYEWQYEEQGYVLPSGPYLPDFKVKLPDLRIVYVEVKSDEFDDFDDTEMSRLWQFSNSVKIPIILLSGQPSVRPYNQIPVGFPHNTLNAVFFKDYDPYVDYVDNYWLQSTEFDERTGRMKFTHDDRAARKSFGQRYVDAIGAARSARFEHGETPTL